MFAIVEIVAPIFAIIAMGYGAVRFKLYPASGVGGIIAFVNNFGAPFLLFRSMLNADFHTAFNLKIILPFYGAAILCLFTGMFLSRRFFKSRKGVSVAAGFSATFSNGVLLGIPIIQRAYGDEALPVILSILGFHALTLITFATLVLEVVRADGGNPVGVLKRAVLNVAKNPMLWGVTLGVIANFLNVHLPEPVDAFVKLMAQAVIPAALFGLGGMLLQYKLADSWKQSVAMALLKLILHPVLAYIIMVPILGVPFDLARYGILLATMPTGFNAYIFATFYDRGVDIAANTILISNVLAVFTITIWLAILGV